MTTQDFVKSPDFANLPPVDFLFVDGLHTEDQAEFDHRSFDEKLTPNGLILFHDSVSEFNTTLYGKEDSYRYSVHNYLQRLKNDSEFQVMDFPFADGLTLVRRNLAVSRERQPPSLYPL